MIADCILTVDSRADERTDGWTDRWIDRQTEFGVALDCKRSEVGAIYSGYPDRHSDRQTHVHPIVKLLISSNYVDFELITAKCLNN